MVMSLPPQFGVGNAGPSDQGGGPGFRPRAVSSFTIIGAERYRILDRKQQWYDATQDNWKPYDFDGQLIQAGFPTAPPNLSQAKLPQFIPLGWRRASNPYRIARVITSAFTRMLFGRGRFPRVTAPGDENTEAWCEALKKETRLASRMIRARNLGGSMGTCVLSWCYKDGQPCINVHNAKHLFVGEWADRDELIPLYVTEMYRYPQDDWDPLKGYTRNWYWYRRDWTDTEEIVYLPILFEDRKEPDWTNAVDTKKSVRHNNGFCPVVWIQNLPSDEIDGESDYETLYDNFDEINQVLSVNSRGTKLNLDPTLVLSGKSMEPAFVQRFGISKGSDNALAVGDGGSASYLEISGQAAQAGLALFQEMRRICFEVAECVVPDPNEIAAQGVSRVALELIYAPMTTKTDVLREQYGEGLRRIFEQMLTIARKYPPGSISLPPKIITPEEQQADWEKEKKEEEAKQAQIDAVEAQKEAERIAALPLPEPDANGMMPPPPPQAPKPPKPPPEPTPEFEAQLVPQDPGQAEYIEMEFGDYFPQTGDDQQKVAVALTTATGGKAVIDQRTASEFMARTLEVDPTEVWDRMKTDQHTDQAAQSAMMGDQTGHAGGAPSPGGGLPFGAQPRKPNPFGGGGGKNGANKAGEGGE